MNIAVIATWLFTGPCGDRSSSPAPSESTSSSATSAVEGRSSCSMPSPRKTPAKTPIVRGTETLKAAKGSPLMATSGTSTANSGRSAPSRVQIHHESVPATTIFATSCNSSNRGRGGGGRSGFSRDRRAFVRTDRGYRDAIAEDA